MHVAQNSSFCRMAAPYSLIAKMTGKIIPSVHVPGSTCLGRAGLLGGEIMVVTSQGHNKLPAHLDGVPEEG
jgi:hypothetical protein